MMTKEPHRTPPKAEEKPAEQPKTEPAPKPSRTAWFTRKRLAILLSLSLLIHVAVLAYVCFGPKPASAPPPAEVSLGDFSYHGDHLEGGRMVKADFSLHVALEHYTDPRVGLLLANHRYRIRQGVEELMRRAHAGDFEDPTLKSLKRRVLERIEETVGERIVSDVMVTQLRVRWNSPDSKTPTETKSAQETAEAIPWTEKPSG